MSQRWELSRRAFLGGSGAVVALPLLDAMMPGLARAQSAAPRRLVFWYVPCGIHMQSWTPASTGALQLSPILQPLGALASECTVLTGLDNHAASSQGDGPGDHARGTGSFLTAAHVRKTEGADIYNGVSVDQLAAQRIGSATRFRSLELGTEGGASTGGCDSGYSCAYARNISWANASTPVAKEINPQLVFDRLFAGFEGNATTAEQAKRRRYKQSVLDYVRGDAQRLQSSLGARDRYKLDEYLTGVRELEVRIERDAAEQASVCAPGTRSAPPGDFVQRIELMSDLMVKALECDQTRIISFMTANAGSGRAHGNLGISEGHHDLSHHQGDAAKHAKLVTINTWEVQVFRSFVQKLYDQVEPNGARLLDSTLVFFSSEIADGDSHSHYQLPVLLAGRGGGAVTPGRHVRYSPTRPIADLFISMLAAVGANVTTFGDEGTAPLTGLT